MNLGDKIVPMDLDRVKLCELLCMKHSLNDK